MRALYAVLTLGLAATPAFANVNLVPEPGSLALVGLAFAIGVAVTRRNKK
jgi:PEP-CTERM motif